MARPREFDTDTAVRAALYVFWRKGYAATTMKDLEQATGMGRMSLYNAFGSKEELFLAALERYIAKSTIRHARSAAVAALTGRMLRRFLHGLRTESLGVETGPY